MDIKSVINATQMEVARRLVNQGAGHGLDHTLRVLRTAEHIQANEGGDRVLIQLAALLHDVGDAKFHQGVERSGEFASEILGGLGVDPTVIAAVVHIVDRISFRTGTPADQLTWEAKIVQDADRLDALGAIGIVRTIEYGATRHQPFHLPKAKEDQPTGMGHFHEKLFKLRQLMHTDTAKSLATQRETFMREFLRQYLAECEPIAKA